MSDDECRDAAMGNSWKVLGSYYFNAKKVMFDVRFWSTSIHSDI